MAKKELAQFTRETTEDPFETYNDEKLTPHQKLDVEDTVAEFLDTKRDLKDLYPILKKLTQGQIDVNTALQMTSPMAFMQAIKLMLLSQSDKVKSDLAKHLLALSGHTPTQKVELGRIDTDTPKQALLAMIKGSEKNLLEEGIEIIDDRAAEDKA
jgi:hypothetical protein